MNYLWYLFGPLMGMVAAFLIFAALSALGLALYKLYKCLMEKFQGHAIKRIDVIGDTYTRYSCTCGVKYLNPRHMEDHIASASK